MKLIGENIHIISKKIREAIENKDEEFIKNLAKRQIDAGMDWIDLNIGPARRSNNETMKLLLGVINQVGSPKYSFDTSNLGEIEAGLLAVTNPQECIIKSTSGDPERLEGMVNIASKYNSYMIALTMSNETGIPKEADGRLEIASVIIERTADAGIYNTKILLDPLVLPVSVDQTQALEALNAIRVFKESFDPPVMTTIGLSNISNGSPKEIRPLINRVFGVMAMGCGLDSAIADAFDTELLRVNKVIESLTPQKASDKLLIDIYNMMQEFGELEDISYNPENPEEEQIYRTARIILNKNIYAHNYLDEVFSGV